MPADHEDLSLLSDLTYASSPFPSSPLSPSITPSLFHSWLKTLIFSTNPFLQLFYLSTYGNDSMFTHEPYLPLLSNHKASPPFGWYSLRLPTERWPGWVDLGGWLYTEINVLHRELNPDTATHLSTNRAWRRLTSLIETNALPLRQTTMCNQWQCIYVCRHKTDYRKFM